MKTILLCLLLTLSGCGFARRDVVTPVALSDGRVVEKRESTTVWSWFKNIDTPIGSSTSQTIEAKATLKDQIEFKTANK